MISILPGSQKPGTTHAHIAFRAATTVVVLLAAATLRVENLPWILFLWSILTFAHVVLRATRLAGILLAGLTLYATAAWLVFTAAAQRYPPFPPLEIVAEATVLDLQCVLFAYATLQVIFGMSQISQVITNSATSLVRRVSALDNRGSTLAIVVVLLTTICALTNWAGVARVGLGAVLQGDRREFAAAVPLATNHNVQFIIIACTIVGGVQIATRSAHRSAIQVGLILCWVPYVLVGSRKELLIVALAGIVTCAPYVSRSARAALSVMVMFLLALPALKSRDIFFSLHEFVLPQHMQFSLHMGIVPSDFGGNFWDRAQFLVPSFLRWADPVDLGSAFYSYGTTNVGVGVSPFAEAEMTNPSLPTQGVFVATFVVLVVAVVLAARRFPIVGVLGFAQLTIFGRSDTWIAAFFVIYTALAVYVILKLGEFFERRFPSRNEHSRANR